MAKKVDPFKAKERKQKILAAVLGVIFLGLVAFNGPRVWKQLNPPAPAQASAPTETTAAPPAGTPTLAAPTLQGGQPLPATTGSGTVAPATTTPPIQDGVLASFSRFASKDPFAQQLKDGTGGSTSSGSGGSSDSGSKTPAPDGGDGGGSSPGVAPTPGTAVITVNGTSYQVAVGTDFPQASTTDPTIVPLFHLVSLGARTAKISIVGGSYADGARTVTLTQNKPVTLMNTADGTRYTLVLKPQGTAVPTETETDGSTPTTVTLPPATP
jgi:hypothetical protein